MGEMNLVGKVRNESDGISNGNAVKQFCDLVY